MDASTLSGVIPPATTPFDDRGEIDLTAAPNGAELRFEGYRDADGVDDTATVRFLRASDAVQLGADAPIDMFTFDNDWTSFAIPVPTEALGQNILIEWNFTSNDSADQFSGFSIDDIVVEILP